MLLNISQPVLWKQQTYPPLPIAAAQLPPSFPIQNAFQDESILISIQQAERSSEIILPDLILVWSVISLLFMSLDVNIRLSNLLVFKKIKKLYCHGKHLKDFSNK